MPLAARSAIALAAVAFFAMHCGARSGLRVPDVVPADAIDVFDVTDTVDATDARDVLDAPDVVIPDCRTVPALCNDGSLCTTDVCNPDGTCAHTAIECVDGDPCTADRCDPSRGCFFPLTECGGCADGQREAFRDRDRYPNIAACSGGFQIRGLATESGAACGFAAGDDGPNPNGAGCSATDLCAPGWHVCRSSRDVGMHSPDGCVGARDAQSGVFFATRQTGPGCLQCATGTNPNCTPFSCQADCAPTPGTSNDLFGCGTAGDMPQMSCAPLDRSGNNLCSSLPAPWRCNDGVDADVHESDVVVKPGSAGGGVLCCRD